MASLSIHERIYDVFLSFRGEDVRNNFLGHLYTALDQKGIYTYVDSEELRKGEQIAPTLMKAIEESQIAIIVFSEDYASSWWCLEEVAKIMDCKEERDLMVFPVFYKVEPKEVRTPREKYREAMLKHESKFGKDSEEVKRWKKALSDAGSLSGWHLKDGNESELLERIVTEISTHLDRTPLHVAKHPVGIDSQVVRLKSMLNLESNNGVLMVGLWGQGGIGKTALGKALYNAIHRQFQGSCFLADVRETAKDCKDLVSLQNKMLSDILSLKRLVLSNVHGGINLVRQRLCRKKVLLILDDVDDMCQLNALAGEGEWFGSGSRIIITTRDKHLLTCHGIDEDHVYEVQALDDNEANELLSKHAFLTHQKLKIRTDLVKSVLTHAKGLPLALEVLGSFLCGRKEHQWESTLKKLSKIPNKTINDVLKISYDGLEENEREIFLHIACFFKGWDSKYIEKVLDSCDFETTIGLEILIERSLISIERGILQVHDLVQVMGMDIVNQECRDDPGRRSRLWLYDDALDVLSRDMVDCAIKAIVLEPSELKEICIGPNAFIKMRRLRVLIVRNVHNSFQGPIYLPNELRWFQWAGCAPWIPEFSSGPKKLMGLHMIKSSITVAPQQFMDFPQLKYINLNDCESLVSMPDLSYTPNLEELNLLNCKNLVEAHESIAYHDKLQVLNFEGCSELSVFPNVLKSKNLRALNLRDCTSFERFPDIPHKLEGLKELNLERIAIKGLPASIENLVSLEKMFLYDCKNLVSLPSSIYKLQNLENLLVECCTNLIGFPKYEDSADPCMNIGLANLRWLDLAGCNLSEVEFLENLSCFPLLSQIVLSKNNIISLPTSINKRDQLIELIVTNCHHLQEIPELPPLLHNLYAEGCESLQKTGDLPPFHDFIHRWLTTADIYSLDPIHPDFVTILPRGEMPEWVLPAENGSVSFMVSEDLYNKFLGLALCVVVGDDEQKEEISFELVSHVNGKRQNWPRFSHYSLDADHIWLEYMTPSKLWGEVDFGQIDGKYIQFSLQVSSRVVKKWGFRIICKHLEDGIKIVLQNNQLIDPALLYEVGQESTYSEAESSVMNKNSSIEIDLHQELQDWRMNNEKHSQIGTKRNHKLILTQGLRTKTLLTSSSTGGDENGGVGLQLLLLE